MFQLGTTTMSGMELEASTAPSFSLQVLPSWFCQVILVPAAASPAL
jgi:hypothetical protein